MITFITGLAIGLVVGVSIVVGLIMYNMPRL